MVEFSDRNSKESQGPSSTSPFGRHARPGGRASDRNSESQESLVDKSIRQAQDLEPRKFAAKSTAKTAWNRQTVCEALVRLRST